MDRGGLDIAAVHVEVHEAVAALSIIQAGHHAFHQDLKAAPAITTARYMSKLAAQGIDAAQRLLEATEEKCFGLRSF